MRSISRTVVLISVLQLPAVGVSGESTERVTSSLAEMHSWVGDGENGRRWKQFLKSEELQSQLALGDDANRSMVGGIHKIYSSDTPGLERVRFVRLRESVQDWMAGLPPDAADLSELAATEKDRYRSVNDSEVQQRKGALRSAMDRLDRFLSGGARDNAEQWKKYLKWQDLNDELAVEERPNTSSLRGVLNSFYADHVGLELSEFTNVRESLRDYRNAVLFRHTPGIKELFNRRIDQLSDHLQKYRETKETPHAVAIGRLLGWLESGNQATDLVKQVRHQYWQPNLFGHASQALVEVAISDTVDELQNVNENILGTSIHGVARMQGRIGLQLVPATQHASFDIEMTGVAAGNNVGYNGPVTVYSYGETQIFSRKRIFLDDTGLTSNYASANCSTSSNINSIAARSKLVRKIAWRRAGRMQGQSEAIAARRAERRVAGRVDSQAAEVLADANKQFTEKARNPLIRWDAYPRRVRFRSDEDRLHLQVLQAGPDQIAAPVPPPAISGSQDLGVRVHESVVGNFSESLLGGRTLTDERLVELLTEAGAEIPEELEIGPDKDPWSISFSTERPVSAEFRDDTVRIGIRGQRFTRGEQAIRNAIEISAAYQYEKRASGVRLARQGEVQVQYVNLDRLSLTQVAMKTFLARKFDALFKEEIVSEGFELPGRWQRAGKLFLSQIASANRWLSLGWNMQPQPAHIEVAQQLTIP